MSGDKTVQICSFTEGLMDEQHQRLVYVQTDEVSSREKTREESVPSVGQGSNEKRWGYFMGQKQLWGHSAYFH